MKVEEAIEYLFGPESMGPDGIDRLIVEMVGDGQYTATVESDGGLSAYSQSTHLSGSDAIVDLAESLAEENQK